ncbi:MAG: hypothetical protein M3O46_09740 [Myxococcota bacterium]|nr:hypothetical protein [Myxococcota bacterium]
MMRYRAGGPFLAFLCFAFACSKPSIDPGGGSTQSADAQSGSSAGKGPGHCKDYKACSLLTTAEISEALGATYSDAKEDHTNLAPKAGPVVTCEYSAAKAFSEVSLHVGCLYAGYDGPTTFKETEDALRKVTTQFETIPGLGTYALLATIGADSKHPELARYMLTVLFGSGGNFTLDFQPDRSRKSFDPVAVAKRLGSAVLSRL